MFAQGMPFDSYSKLARIREAMARRDWGRALKLAAQFQELGDEAICIRRANDAINNPRLYEQLGHDLARIRRDGIAALKKRFSKSWKDVQLSGHKTSQTTQKG
jgi:hypothetical protein